MEAGVSLFEYRLSKEVDALGAPFYALVMAAMRQADTANAAALRAAFPEVWVEFQQRYDAPRGLLPGEKDPEGWRADERGALVDPFGHVQRGPQ